jgi:hypothetical protein
MERLSNNLDSGKKETEFSDLPGEPGLTSGHIIKHVGMLATDDPNYCRFAQLLELKFPRRKKKIVRTVRFGYYVWKSGKKEKKKSWWHGGSQWTYNAPIEFTKRLLKRAKKAGIL